MKKLKILFQYNSFFYLFLIFSLLFCFINVNYFKSESIFTNESKIEGVVIDKLYKNEKYTITLKSKEKILVNYYSKKEIDLDFGDTILVKGKIIDPNNNTNFNLFNYKNYLLSKKIKKSFLASSLYIKQKNNNPFYIIKNKIYKRCNKFKNTNSYIKTFIVGDKTDISEISEKYQYLGISHLFCISGMHVGLLTGLLLFLLKKNKFKYVISNIFLLFYLFITNFSISILRASLIFIINSIFKCFNIKIEIKDTLLLLASLFIILNPYIIYDVSFLFSFSITYFIIISENVIKKYSNYFIKILIVSIISFLASIPIISINFYQVNYLSVIFNIFFIPFISFIIFPLILLTFIFPIFNNALFFLIELMNSFINIISNIKSIIYVPKNPLLVLIIYYLFLYLSLKREKRIYISFFIIVLFIVLNFNRIVNCNIFFLDVGQGDSTIIRIKSKNIMVDTGGIVSFKNKTYDLTKNVHLPFLKSIGIKKIDYLILTHGDFDHMGEAVNLVNNFKVEKVIFNCGEFNDLESELIKVLDKKKIKYYSCIKELKIENNKLYFLQTKEYDNENDNSNVIYTELNGYKFMFMGDASSATEKEILNKYNLLDIDVLKVGHHGSKTSSSNVFINVINPKYSIISVGKKNRYGHPNKEVLNTLSNSKVYRTDQDGSIMFKIKNNKLKIETCTP